MLAIDRILPNPHQPRKRFDAGSLELLAGSMRAHGLVQPVMVSRRQDADDRDSYYLIAGERRLRAARLAGMNELPCIVRPAERQEMLELALVEKIHRTDLDPIERAAGYRDMMDRFSLTQLQVAERVGQPRTTVANYLRMLDLCDEVQAMIADGALSFGHAKVLAGLAAAAPEQKALAGRAVREGLSVRRFEQIIQARQVAASGGDGKDRGQKSAWLAEVEEQLGRTVGTKVTVREGPRKHSGKIVIDYYSLDDFDRITGLLGAEIES